MVAQFSQIWSILFNQFSCMCTTCTRINKYILCYSPFEQKHACNIYKITSGLPDKCCANVFEGFLVFRGGKF